MSDLRWILLIFGVILILAIYLFDRFSHQFKRSTGRLRQSKDSSTPHFGDASSASETLTYEPPSSPVSTTSFHEDDQSDNFDLELADLTDLIREAVNESKEPFLNANNNSAGSDPDAAQTDKDALDDGALIPLINGNIIVINLLPREQKEFTGPDLLNAFAKLNIVYGDMRIFHYTEDRQRLFSIANLVEPGVFEPESMLEFTTKGISLFMQLNELVKPVTCFERMLEIVWELANALNADICDIKCEVITPQSANELLDAVKYFESNVY